MKLIIIEDDAEFASVLRELLEEDPEFSVETIINNEEDARAFAKSGRLNEVHCLLLDLQLPKCAGDSTVSSTAGLRLANEFRNVHSFYGTILILTNSKSFTDGTQAMGSGCDGYLCKHAKMEDVSEMITELKAAIKGDVMVVSRELRHVFFRGDVTPKEACLMSLLSAGHGWDEIAQKLGYKNSKAAANVADRIYDKLLSPEERSRCEADGLKKRQKALEVWRRRYGATAVAP